MYEEVIDRSSGDFTDLIVVSQTTREAICSTWRMSITSNRMKLPLGASGLERMPFGITEPNLLLCFSTRCIELNKILGLKLRSHL